MSNFRRFNKPNRRSEAEHTKLHIKDLLNGGLVITGVDSKVLSKIDLVINISDGQVTTHASVIGSTNVMDRIPIEDLVKLGGATSTAQKIFKQQVRREDEKPLNAFIDNSLIGVDPSKIDTVKTKLSTDAQLKSNCKETMLLHKAIVNQKEALEKLPQPTKDDPPIVHKADTVARNVISITLRHGSDAIREQQRSIAEGKTQPVSSLLKKVPKTFSKFLRTPIQVNKPAWKAIFPKDISKFPHFTLEEINNNLGRDYFLDWEAYKDTVGSFLQQDRPETEAFQLPYISPFILELTAYMTWDPDEKVQRPLKGVVPLSGYAASTLKQAVFNWQCLIAQADLELKGEIPWKDQDDPQEVKDARNAKPPKVWKYKERTDLIKQMRQDAKYIPTELFPLKGGTMPVPGLSALFKKPASSYNLIEVKKVKYRSMNFRRLNTRLTREASRVHQDIEQIYPEAASEVYAYLSSFNHEVTQVLAARALGASFDSLEILGVDPEIYQSGTFSENKEESSPENWG